MQNILDHPEILKKQSENALNPARDLSIEKQLRMIESVYKSTLSS